MTEKKKKKPVEISRRDFLKDAGLLIGGTAISSTVLLSACGDQEAVATPWLPEKWDKEADVVIIGYGGAGATLGLSIAEQGAKVIILEKGSFGGGNSALLEGPPSSIMMKDEAKGLEYLDWLCGDQTEEDVLKAYISYNKEIPSLQSKLGFELVEDPQPGGFPEYPGAPGAETIYTYRIASIPPGPSEYNAIAKLAEEAGVEIIYNTPATKLIQNPNTKEILGVRANNGSEIYVKGRKATVLACGGFEFDEEMCRQYITHCPICFVGSKNLTGDGIKMAQDVGAQLWHMNSLTGPMYLGVKYDDDLVYTTVETLAFPIFMVPPKKYAFQEAGSFIWANKYGNRFNSEILPFNDGEDMHRFKAREIWLSFNVETAEFRNIPAFQIFDEKARLAGPIAKVFSVTTPAWSNDSVEEIEKGWLLKADTIEELALKCEIPTITGVTRGGHIDPTKLKETIDRYNANCQSGVDPDFGRTVSLLPLDTPPYYAMGPMFPAFVNTHGGPKHDNKQRVLDTDDKPIPRLYAIGECGSLWGHLYNGGGDACEFLTSALCAADNVINETAWE